MPYVKHVELVKIPLPSDPSYFIMWRDRVPYGALKAARSNAVVLHYDPDEGSEPKPQFDAVAYNDYALLAHIASWNLDDEEGEPLPLTIESLGVLDNEDVSVLNERMSGILKNQESDQKNSSERSGPSSKGR